MQMLVGFLFNENKLQRRKRLASTHTQQDKTKSTAVAEIRVKNLGLNVLRFLG